jgi:hypothetical protein
VTGQAVVEIAVAFPVVEPAVVEHPAPTPTTARAGIRIQGHLR